MVALQTMLAAQPFSAGCMPRKSFRQTIRRQAAIRCAADRQPEQAGGSGREAPSRMRRAALKALVATVATVGTSAGAVRAFDLMAPPGGSTEPREGEVRHSEAEWRELLTPDQYAVLREAATEKRFSSPLYDEHRAGTFVCAGCDSPLFTSDMKYNSGTGWPSFFDALPGSVDLKRDFSIAFMPRTEVRCHQCQGHLGHVFDDGPPPTRYRYCMNGLALKFEPKEA